MSSLLYKNISNPNKFNLRLLLKILSNVMNLNTFTSSNTIDYKSNFLFFKFLLHRLRINTLLKSTVQYLYLTYRHHLAHDILLYQI